MHATESMRDRYHRSQMGISSVTMIMFHASMLLPYQFVTRKARLAYKLSFLVPLYRNTKLHARCEQELFSNPYVLSPPYEYKLFEAPFPTCQR
jgi:hypothetical protein